MSASAGKETEHTNGSLLVVNLRGMVNTRTPVKTTLQQMSIARRFNATIIQDNKVHRGMLTLAKEHVAWCKLDSGIPEKLLRSRSDRSTGKKIEESQLGKEFGSFAALAKELESGRVKLSSIEEIRPFFRLSPPRGGFKRSTRRQYAEGGILGYNKELAQIVEKMM